VDDWLIPEDPLARAQRYREVAVQYSDFAEACISPFLRGFYRRIAEDYLSRAEVVLTSCGKRSGPFIERQGLSKRNRGSATPPSHVSPVPCLPRAGSCEATWHMDTRPS
jgi:hypothetical protein